MVAVILGALFLVASVTWLLWSAFSPYAVWQRKDILFQICYGMYGFMDLVCIGKLKIFKQHRLWFKTVTISIFLIGHANYHSSSLQIYSQLIPLASSAFYSVANRKEPKKLYSQIHQCIPKILVVRAGSV